ncbi:MAG: glycine--tRNA ligase subunit beta [Gammaproteobacteria bacterium]|jgi:glycyl-tRNA synthetase beta chain|nr:glycine--tRNA ligase subunit beta [Gammaproteobacteria bacterium]MDP6616875.1 glycine--tRNA ligase subunit beta [Gammaproteobacteria bacterium]MDP6694565.1 glycine--tRNA ligase subunit beta [Gammaproteobacteria bacterium]
MSKAAAADFLVELGAEELPPKSLALLRDSFAAGIAAGLDSARLGYAELTAYATPRRLAVLVNKMVTQQPTQEIESRGPPINLAYDDAGKPTRAAEAFASKNNVTTDQLETLKTDKGEWLYYKGQSEGAAATELLPDIVSNALASLPVPKRMRWGSGDVEFVRPVHWLVMLLGKDMVPATVLGLDAGSVSFGHRFHAPGAIKISKPSDYVSTLRKQGHVLVDFAERRDAIKTAAVKAAKKAGGDAVLEPAVVDEVTALVEWPVPVAGRFDERFLRLPPEVLVSTLQDHQRYFPVQKGGQLLPAFIAISNLDSNDPDQVRCGNERVVLPRLADAAFFWDQDTAKTLASREPDLKAVVYQQGLGSLYDKSVRVAGMAQSTATLTSASGKEVARAALLARTDLLTNMVGEFPELQGRMGYYYANHDGEPANVAVALEEQYLPRHAGDRLPANPVGIALGLADRLDTLAGIFCLGKRPSGNKDPFGLRRQALGLVRILIEGGLDADLPTLIDRAIAVQPVEGVAADTSAELLAFVMERLRAWYVDGQAPGFAPGDVSVEMFESVLARAPASPLDFHQRLQAVQQFMHMDSAVSLAAANKRIANILKQAENIDSTTVDIQLFDAKEEQLLHEAVVAVLPGHKTDLAARNYESALQRLAELRDPVDGYFDQVMVMTEDTKLRSNRLAQLGQLRKLFLDVADISRIPTP